MNARFPDTLPLEELLGYRFRERAFLIEALTHKSFFFENQGASPGYNERLEFLGDSVVGLVTSDYLFDHSEKMTESVMSKARSYVVKGAVLSTVAEDLGLGRYLLLGRGEEDTGGRTKPSLLTDAFEALMGAIYLDGGFAEAQRVVLGLLRDRLDDAIASGDYRDYKTMLQERCQRDYGMLPSYRLSAEEGRDHEKVFTVEAWVRDIPAGSGRGRTKKEAEQTAAREALDKLFPADK